MADDINLNIQTGSASHPSGTTSDGVPVRLTGLRDGTGSFLDWTFMECVRGRVYCANAGTASSPLTFGAGDIDTTEPDLFLSVPSGTSVIPLEIRVQMETYGTTLLFEGIAAIGTGGVAGTDTDLVAGTNICNLRSDAPNASLCTVAHSATADATYMTTNVSEFWRFGLQKAVTNSTADDDSTIYPAAFVWSAKERGYFPVLKGASQMMVFCSGQAGTGFITVIFIEVPSTYLV